MLNKIKNNIIYIGANQRPSLLDVYLPKKDGPNPIVIFMHGFKGFKDWGHFNLIPEHFTSQGFAFLKFNTSHNGGTINNPIDFPDVAAFSQNTYSNEIQDLDAILNFLEEKMADFSESIDLNQIYLIGHSRGGAICTLKASSDNRIAKLVSWAAVDDLPSRLPNENALKHWKKTGVHFIKNARTEQEMPMNYHFVSDLLTNKQQLDVENACKEMKIPHLIIHGTNDEAVGHVAAENIFKWNPNAELFLIEGAGHTFGGRHPYSSNELPKQTSMILTKTIDFLKA